jgi:prephenate dehydratase
MKRIAFLGPVGTVSEESARYFFAGQDCEMVPFKLISEVFHATDSGQTDLSVIPIENTIEGSVSLHMDLLVHDYDLPMQAEWIYPSVQNLITLASTDTLDEASIFASIKKIVTHPVVFTQCGQFIKEHLAHAELESVSSTAEGVRIVKNSPGEGIAAIGTSLAAHKYGLDIVKSGVQDHNNNYTRFILLGREQIPASPSNEMKTSILITLPEDYPGALHQVLSAFAWRRINLSKIESRPTRKRLGSYYFYIDILETLDSVLLPAAIAEIEAIGCLVRILGCYPTYAYHNTNSEV